MIYAYIFVMAGVTYLIRMSASYIGAKEDYQCLCTFVFILYSLCLPDCNDISGCSLCSQLANRCILWLYHGCIYGIKKEKLDCSSFVSLHCCVFGGKNCGVFVKKL